jgi:hypothetical protein
LLSATGIFVFLDALRDRLHPRDSGTVHEK